MGFLKNIVGGGQQDRYPGLDPEDPLAQQFDASGFRSLDPAAPPQPVHKGLFGMKGGLRDIIGLIGDGMLVNDGRERIYGPGKEKQQVGDAMEGFTSNPLESIQKLAQVNPALAQKYYNDYLDSQAKTTTANAAAAKESAAQEGLARARASSWLIAGMPREAVIANLKAKGYEFEIPDTINPTELRQWAMGEVDPKDLLTDQRLSSDSVERGRHNRATEEQADRALKAGTILRGGTLVQSGIRNDISRDNANKPKGASSKRPPPSGAGRPRTQGASKYKPGARVESNGHWFTWNGSRMVPD